MRTTWLIILVACTALSAKVQTISPPDIQFKLNKKWHLENELEQPKLHYYVYKRQAITDDEGYEIIPNFTVITEEIDSTQDLMGYSILKRLAMDFNVDRVISQASGELEMKQAIGYIGHFTHKKLEKTVYVVHAIRGSYGLQFIGEITTSVKDDVEREMLKIMKSIEPI
ncbi:hypothetical protein GC194_13305 [bacterium]|nr:hypothetical protein [bacterium]